MKKIPTKLLTRSGVIGALYVVLTFVVLPIASGAIQFRPSEALTILPLFFAESIPALFIGCIIANLISGCALLDIIFGSLITLVSASLTFFVGKLFKNKWAKIFIGGMFPVLLNAFLLPLVWYFCYGKLAYLYILEVCFLLVSEGLVVYGLGSLLYVSVSKLIVKFPSLFGGSTLTKL